MTAPGITLAADEAPASRLSEWIDRQVAQLLILPTVLILLGLSIFPMLISAYLALSKFSLAPGGYQLRFVGFRNFKKLLFGSQQFHFLGTFGSLAWFEWLLLLAAAAGVVFGFLRYLRRGRVSPVGILGRLIAGSLALALLLLLLITLNAPGFPGSLVVTLFYVLAGVALQFGLGLGLALLCAQQIRGRNFFRVVFFVPLMVTPVGIAYAFRMLADMGKGPFAPVWQLFGLAEFAWSADPWSARLVVLIGDTWQWTPFLFLILLAAIENQPRDQIEAARIDGASSWQVFRDITWPAIAPVAATVVLIRLIEAFKIIDLPNVLTNGGPGIATESMTLHAFIAWRTQDLGGSAAVGYMLLFVAVVSCVSFFNFVVRPARRHEA
ncbi:MAG: sugar ABC transporter permease [Kiloniellales bacterium]|nr:sugar ABC transporter permease [Kiloniellales bacterium]